MEERNIAKSCKLMYQQQMQQQIIINGIPQGGKTIEIPYLVCPSCGNVIAQFNGETAITTIYDYCEKELQNKISYCIKCGQKLKFPTMITCNDLQETKNE